MAVKAEIRGSIGSAATRKRISASEVRFDILVSVFSLWMIIGLYVDGWAHNHGFVDTSFFTPWHALLYSGFFAVSGCIGAAAISKKLSGSAWNAILLPEYMYALLGMALFFIGGFSDMLWHILFGIERGIEALLSPTHLLLASGGSLIVTAPLRRAWNRLTSPVGLWGWFPVLVSAGIFLSVLTFFTVFFHPVGLPTADAPAPSLSNFLSVQSLGIGSIILQSSVLTGLFLLLARRWTLPAGSFTLLISLNTIGMAILSHENLYQFVPAALLTGIGADVLYRWLRPAAKNLTRIRLFAFLLPCLFYALYFAALLATTGIWWTIHLWAGSIVIAGIAGYLSSLLIYPPAVPGEQDRTR